jgi:hypothetical protein
MLSDGHQVELIGTAERSGQPQGWYALPNQLMTAETPDGEPEFLFMAFTTDDRPDDGGASGGLLHALVTWGFRPEQEAELTDAVAGFGAGAEYKGFVQMLPPDGNAASFAVISAVISDETFATNVITSGQAPLVAGGRAAFATRLDPNGAQALFKTFEEDTPIADLSVSMNFAYVTQVQGPKGTVSIDWDRIETQSDRLETEYKEEYGWAENRKRCWLFWKCDEPTTEYSYVETRSQFDLLIENELMTFEFEEGFPSERAAPIRDAFIQYFINLMSDPVPPPMTLEDAEDEEAEAPETRRGSYYKFERTRTQTAMQFKNKELNLDYKFQIKWPHNITGNIKSWADDARAFEHRYQKVVLDDPFFQWRDIVAVVDVEAKELFEDQVNFATVSLEKQRPEGTWRESITFDKDYLTNNGVQATRTYARGVGPASDSYRWRAQWSLRGGRTWPEDPPWQEGSWEGLTVAVPLQGRTIDFDANLDELEASGFTRVTAQVRYPMLGEEKLQNIAIPVMGDSPSASAQIFMNAGAEGYAYRLVLNHRRLGKMATDWTFKANDDYIYALIPEELLVTDEDDPGPAVTEAIEASAEPTESVLEEFGQVLQ